MIMHRVLVAFIVCGFYPLHAMDDEARKVSIREAVKTHQEFRTLQNIFILTDEFSEQKQKTFNRIAYLMAQRKSVPQSSDPYFMQGFLSGYALYSKKEKNVNLSVGVIRFPDRSTMHLINLKNGRMFREVDGSIKITPDQGEGKAHISELSGNVWHEVSEGDYFAFPFGKHVTIVSVSKGAVLYDNILHNKLVAAAACDENGAECITQSDDKIYFFPIQKIYQIVNTLSYEQHELLENLAQAARETKNNPSRKYGIDATPEQWQTWEKLQKIFKNNEAGSAIDQLKLYIRKKSDRESSSSSSIM